MSLAAFQRRVLGQGDVLLHLHGRAFKLYSGKSYFVGLLACKISAELAYISSSTYRSLIYLVAEEAFFMNEAPWLGYDYTQVPRAGFPRTSTLML